MPPKTLPVLLVVAILASTAFFLYELAGPRSTVSSTAPLPSAPEAGHSQTAAFSEQPAWPSSVAESRTASADTAPASERLAAHIPAKTPVRAARVPPKPYNPMVFQEFDYQAAGLTPMQIQVLDSLSEDFIREVGGPQQDPRDPRYAERWRQLQPIYDDKLRAALGDTFAEQLGLLAAQVRSEPTLKK